MIDSPKIFIPIKDVYLLFIIIISKASTAATTTILFNLIDILLKEYLLTNKAVETATKQPKSTEWWTIVFQATVLYSKWRSVVRTAVEFKPLLTLQTFSKN